MPGTLARVGISKAITIAVQNIRPAVAVHVTETDAAAAKVLVRGAEDRILNEAAVGLKDQKDENGNIIPIDYLKLFADQLVSSSGKMVLLAKVRRP